MLVFLAGWAQMARAQGLTSPGTQAQDLTSQGTQAHDSLLIRRLIDRIGAQQVTRDGFYFHGAFPTLRAWAATPANLKADNSIFFTGLIVFTLHQLEPYLQGEERVLCDSIVQRGIRSYVHYRNRKGGPSYNFWPSDRAVFFPNSTLLDHFKDSKQITDDLDDTGILYLGSGTPDSTARRLKVMMGAHANGHTEAEARGQTGEGAPGPVKRITNSYRATRDLPAYSAWFGVKTPIEFDAGVFANVLYWIYACGLTTDVHDSASVLFLRYILAKRKYWTDAAYASSYYPRTPVLIYHLARLLGRFPLDTLMSFKPRLEADARKALKASQDGMDRVILATSLIRLGDSTDLPDFSATVEDVEQDPFVFYIANISCLFPNPIRRIFLHNPLCIFHFYAPAYNDALLLEYLVLRRRQSEATASKSTP
jgi:hypothetical protein